MKGLDSVFSVSLAKSLGAKSFMLLCGALLGLSPLPWKRKKNILPFFWIEMTQVDYFHCATPRRGGYKVCWAPNAAGPLGSR